ncbi:ferric reductase-like transmembrane domain-containing protein [Streptomyces sp. NPDC003717]|uniref:ferric reductase-like transmembrane domain-containing protein n=1 Tax=Streptomyces sp. NPDC003717 TaxID=3154276 RepID=UPI0033B1CE7E
MTTDSTADDALAQFLDFGAGVLSLVFLSCSVIWGLVAQDRVVLGPRQRITAQAVHRATAVASVVFLLVHIGVKLALAHTTWVAAVVPFGLLATDDEQFGGRAVLIGLGTLASLLMVFVSVTGALRNRFASPAPVAARWRAMHMLAYPAWCAALVHGLYAGRSAKPLFTFLYGLSLAGVMAALALRAAPRPVKRRIAERVAALFDGGRDAGGGRERVTREAPRAPRRERTAGFAAAYRAVSSPTTPHTGTGTGTYGNWPVPSPPPVGEAPPSAYDPLADTGHTIPVQGVPDTFRPAPRDLHDTAESHTGPDPYYPYDTRIGGPTPDPSPYPTPYPTHLPYPTTHPTPGASHDFGAPAPGDPWHTPSGGNE